MEDKTQKRHFQHCEETRWVISQSSNSVEYPKAILNASFQQKKMQDRKILSKRQDKRNTQSTNHSFHSCDSNAPYSLGYIAYAENAYIQGPKNEFFVAMQMYM